MYVPSSILHDFDAAKVFGEFLIPWIYPTHILEYIRGFGMAVYYYIKLCNYRLEVYHMQYNETEDSLKRDLMMQNFLQNFLVHNWHCRT